MQLRFAHAAAAAALALAGTAQAQGQHDDHRPRHGGIVVETRALDFEIVAAPEVIRVYVGDHGKPVSLQGASGKVTLLNGSEKTEAPLAVAGDRFEARGPFKVARGTKGIATVTLAGRPAATARFELK
jgi:hypothetical protein